MTKEKKERLVLALCVGLLLAVPAFLMGIESGYSFLGRLGNLIRVYPIGHIPAPILSQIAPAMITMLGVSATAINTIVLHLIIVFSKWWQEVWSPDKPISKDAFGEMSDLGTENGVMFLVFGVVIAAFVCGFYTPILEYRAVAVALAVAALPSILQLIDLHGQRRRT